MNSSPSLHEAQVARAQKRSLASVRQMGVERLFGLFRPLPVALRDAGAADPNFADLIGGQADVMVCGSAITIRWSSRLPPQPTNSTLPSSSGRASTT